MVPDGWSAQSVGEFCEFFNGNGFKASEWSTQGWPIIRIQNLNGSSDFNYFNGEVKDRWVVEPGDILFAWAGTKGVSFGAKRWFGPRGVLNQHIFRVEPKMKVNPDWLYFALIRVTECVENKAHGFKATLLHVQKSDIAEQVIPVPPLLEQNSIARILSTWDEAIATTEQLLANSEQQKKALMQQLLTGKKRLPGFQGEWLSVKLVDIFRRVTTKNDGQSANVVTISGQQGLIRQQEFFKKAVASEVLDGYFLLKKGQFAYNKSYSKGYPMGAVKRLNRYPEAVVTTLYICFEIADEKVASGDYFEHYFEAGFLNRGLSKVANEGGRAHGLLNVKPADFFSLHISLPNLDEQKAIAKVIASAEKEVQELEKDLSLLQKQKKALMQQLLTGKRRVKVDEAERATA
ncbi:MAG: restriction endonuclease subunit S [Alcanivorax sp.]